MPPLYTGLVPNLRFGAFEVDLTNNELRKGGTLLKLAPQPFQILRLLAESGGEICTRETIRQAVWGDGTHVDFDRNLNVYMAQIRAALSDDADAPRFIQTVPRRGYRFVAPVERSGVEPPPPGRKFPVVPAAIAGLLIIAALIWWMAGRSAPPLSRPLVATLPFDDLSSDARSGAFIDGLTEELIGSFGAAAPSRLGVIARTSVMRFKGARAGADEIGRQLGADYLVEGSLRWEGPRVHVQARLIAVKDQSQVASDAADFDAADAFGAQQRIAGRLAAAFTNHLFPGAVATATKRAYPAAVSDLYLAGRLEQRRGTREGLEQARKSFQNAIAADHDFAEAWSAMSEVYVALGRSGSPPQDTFPRARQAASIALRLDESLAEAHNSLANALFWYDWNWAEAGRHFERAIELNPSLAVAHHDYAFLLAALGRAPDALPPFRQALALDPLSPRIHLDSGWLLLQAQHYDEAIIRARRSLELAPDLSEAHFCILRAALAKQDYAAAVAELNRVTDKRLAGDPEAAIKDYLREIAGTVRDPFIAAIWHTFLGDRTAALGDLERGLAEHRPAMVLLRSEPLLRPLHGESRFEAIARTMKLPVKPRNP